VRIALYLLGFTGWLATAAAPAGDLARAAEQALAGQPGAVVLLEVATGALLVAHPEPTAAMRLAPPGSTVKPFTLAALLETRAIPPDWSRPCPRKLRPQGRLLDCSHPESGGALAPVEALAYSCNAYFWEAAARLPPGRLPRLLTRFGWDALTGLVPGEAVGRIGQPASLERQRLQAIGEADLLVTPLALAAAYRRLALASNGPRPQPPAIYQGLTAAVRYGTGHLTQGSGPPVAGKTGTARSQSGPWLHAWFAGWVPAVAPEIVVVVFLENGRGGADAAPIARNMIEAWQAARSPR
jgi:cell division protein FtsI/penicillin-binding protein 2